MEQKIINLKAFIDGNDNYDFINQLVRDFFEEEIGCKCKLHQYKSRLNQLWENQIKQQYENEFKN